MEWFWANTTRLKTQLEAPFAKGLGRMDGVGAGGGRVVFPPYLLAAAGITRRCHLKAVIGICDGISIQWGHFLGK